MPRHLFPFRLVAAIVVFVALGARAALTDKIEVDEGDVQKTGEVGVKLHLNTTSSGRAEPRFEREIPSAHGWRLTPEITYGIARDFELGTTLPFVHAPVGGNRSAGVRAAVKWNPVHPAEGAAGTMASVQFEYGWISRRFQEDTRVVDVTPILSWHDDDWLLAANPMLEFVLAGPGRGSRPTFNPALKVARRVAEGVSIGPEYFGGLGPLGEFTARGGQSHTLYLAVDVDRGPWAFNFGVGRGLTTATDRWTAKAIVELAF